MSIDDVHKTLKRVPSKTSTDPDGLSYYVLKQGGTVLTTYLFHIFNLSIELSRVPSAWKTAMITPLHKGGSKSQVQNYRPISVTSCCSRVLERIINHKIKSFLTQNRLIANTQHGFQTGRSTDTALLQFYDHVTKYTDNNHTVDAVFFDFTKAFDTVPHTVLITRLDNIGIRGQALDWINDFLSSRYQRVRVGESFSRPLPVSSGVIQGTVLGPTLFNIFVNDLDGCLNFCRIIKYADDLRIYLSSSKSSVDMRILHSKLQTDIDSLANWACQSGMSFNVSKCFSVTFGHSPRSEVDWTYNIKGALIPRKSVFRDLGVTVCSPLSFNSYVDDIVARAFRRLGLIRKLFHFKSSKSIVRLFKSFVRPVVEYASIVWNPYTKIYTNKIERVQKRMCRMVPGIQHISYREQLKVLGLLSLEARRIRYQLLSIFKLRNGLTDLKFEEYFTLNTDKRTRGHSQTIRVKFAKNNYRLNFFSVSAINLWNQLPDRDVCAPNLINFKISLDHFFREHDIW
jgi:hypothetical protein